MSQFPLVVFENGEESHPDAVVRSECGNWVTCIIGDRAHRYPTREVAEIVEEVSYGPE